jgi:hypothetical protein
LLGQDGEQEVQVEVDNSPPLFFGFSIGFHFLFHGFDSSIVLKTKLHRSGSPAVECCAKLNA